MHFIASQYTKKRKTGNSKITISFLSTQLRQPQNRCCTCRNNDSDAIELTMNQTSDTLEAPPALGKNLNSWTQKRAYGRHRKFERQLAKPSRNLGRKPQERNPQWNRDNSKELWKPKEVCRKWREHVLWRLTDTEIVTKFALRIESLS